MRYFNPLQESLELFVGDVIVRHEQAAQVEQGARVAIYPQLHALHLERSQFVECFCYASMFLMLGELIAGDSTNS
jgi:hypothetical protein